MSKNVYPRPQFAREQWQNLNGSWQFAFDDNNVGLHEKWYQKHDFDQEIQVPFVYQAKLSGVATRDIHDVVWYEKLINCQKKAGKKTLLHFGAVDYEALVYINGNFVGRHQGGHTSFSFDITNYLVGDLQKITLRVEDPHLDEEIPRGKQFWEETSRGIWYTNSTGIWQTVWIEEVDEAHLENVFFTPELDNGSVTCRFVFSQAAVGDKLRIVISFKDQIIIEDEIHIIAKEMIRSFDVYQQKIFRTNFHDAGYTWTPENPNLFDVSLQLLKENIVVDEVVSYFGMRKVHTENGMVYLNNQPYYQRLVLDQGYWPDGLMTAPSDEDLIQDITLAKEMGFNGCRKHQKVEDPRFLYWADQLGYLVWGECASAPVYSEKAVTRLTVEWTEIVERDYNHPSIITWVPLNESWGVPEIHGNKQQQSFSVGIYHLLHALDKTRLVISNDGWEMTTTDICAIHNYSHGQADETQKYAHFKRSLADVDGLLNLPPGKWQTFASGFYYEGQPIMLTEFGGIGYKIGDQGGWGYTAVTNEEDFITDYDRIMSAVFSSTALWGFCYTQLSDVEQEINGLLTYDRKAKVDLAKIKAINLQYYPAQIHLAGNIN
ncbi:beta-glucuronidase [Enterococcus saigonensis]|uniref:Beta-glucuronidase n=1 Tax=Enterococcus saigonensis TaxID=1805431 RepID=A0A679IF06_9ENTE|nr:sugar-binding domain-containing protein [Enterococcus saigonensis]BCA86713.1 beta-glucuronidase [Enterococcus saigonensis]